MSRSPREATAEMDARDKFLYWWPVISRLLGAAMATHQVLFENIDRPSILALAGGLLLAPNFMEAQRKRNARRQDGGDD